MIGIDSIITLPPNGKTVMFVCQKSKDKIKLLGNNNEEEFMVPRLECHSKHSNNGRYIIAGTSLENTGRKSIFLKNAYLLLIYPSSIDHDEGIKKYIRVLVLKERN